MANISLADFPAFINQQIESRQILSNQLEKAEALAYIATGEDFLDHPGETVHAYLLVLSDVIEKTKAFNEVALKEILGMLTSMTHTETII